MIDADPMKAHLAQSKIRHIINGGGEVIFGDHALKRMRERKLDRSDAVNVLKRGLCGEAEFENGGCRYPVRTTNMTFVVEFESETELVVVTGWRNDR